MKGGGNITDITQEMGVKLISKYWSNVEGMSNDKVIYSFVGDIHGDLHQFLAPLVLNNVIKLTGDVEVVDEKIKLYVPKYDVVDVKKVDGKVDDKVDSCPTCSSCKIMYLGDVANEWIFSRQIAIMLYDLLKKDKVAYIYGNHDLSIIGRYHLFKEHTLKIPEDIPSLWETIKKELNCIPNIKIFRDTILYDNDAEKGERFLYEYISPLFDNLFKIFNEQLGRVSYAASFNKTPFIISH